MPLVHAVALAWLLSFLLAMPIGGAQAGASDVQTEDLVDIFHQARSADPRLRGQFHELEQLREQRRESRSLLMPQLSFSADVRRTRRDQTQSGLGGEEEMTRDFTMENYGLNLTQPLVDMPAWHQLRRGDRQVDQGEAELEATRQELVARVLQAYLTVLSAQSELALARHERDAIDASRERIEGLYEERMAAITDLEEVRARRDSVHAAVIRAEGDLDVALERLSEITGTPHHRLAGLRADAPLPPLGPDDLDAWVAQALDINPRLRAAMARVAAAESDIRGARAQRYPSLDLVASYSYLDDLDGSPYGRKYEDSAIGLRLEVPLYTGGAIGARTRGAGHARDQQRQALEATRREIRANVRSAYRALQSGRSEIRALEQAVRSNERSVEAVDAGFAAGLRPLVDILDAQRDLFAARRNLAEARHEFLINRIELLLSAGVLSEEDIMVINDMLVSTQ